MKVRVRQVIAADHHIVAVIGIPGQGDRIFERFHDMPEGQWGEISLPAEVIQASQSAPRKPGSSTRRKSRRRNE